MDPAQIAGPERRVDIGRLKKTIIWRLAYLPLILGLIFFWPAGTFRFWQAWVYVAILFIPMLGVFAYFIRRDPELLERRMKAKEKERRQKTIIGLSSLVFIGIYLLPGFDRRYGWSSVPVIVVVAADIIILGGYGLFVRVLKENRYASRIVEVAEKQPVIMTGPYAVVRHPMYVAVGIIYVLSPLALGSYWAMLPALLVILVLVARISNEEKVLIRELSEYREYMQRVRYRLIPGIW
ncbi:MAG: isoprenylcysteine carboxylmethyltransferase family protein [Candidatus Aminicenantes bacterium]|nr:isoprenylcysteine carboxylmethyltransferase family protein [Candidatus Aminicenantes bacterium]